MSFLSVEHKIELLTDKLSFSEFESQKQSRYTKGSAPGYKLRDEEGGYQRENIYHRCHSNLFY